MGVVKVWNNLKQKNMNNIKKLKKELGLKDKHLAGFFGLKHNVYSRSSAKKRYEQAFINIYKFLNENIKSNN